MKRLITALVATAATFSVASPSIALEEEFSEEFYEGLGNKNSDQTEQKYDSGFSEKGVYSDPEYVGHQFEG